MLHKQEALLSLSKPIVLPSRVTRKSYTECSKSGLKEKIQKSNRAVSMF